MKNIPKYAIIFAVLYLLVIGVGGYGFYWAYSLRNEAIATKNQKYQDLERELKSKVFPDPINLKQLESDLEALKQVFDEGSKEISVSAKLLDPVRTWTDFKKNPVGKEPNAFKEYLLIKREEMQKLAQSNKVMLPVKKANDPYWFTFDRYREAQPDPDKTGLIGIQLTAIEDLTKIIFTSGVRSLDELKRCLAEDSNPMDSRDPEGLPSALLRGPEDLYQIYPFQFKVTFEELDTLNQLINKINQSQFLYIIRYVDVFNDKQDVESKSSYTNSGDGDGKIEFIPILGQEKMSAEIRVDLIEWLQLAPSKPEDKK